jgi:hypothetical protein
LEHGSEDPPQVPQVLLSQARLAARNGVKLDTVLRRYFAGFALFGDFVIGEGEDAALPEGATVQELLATEATHFDRLIEAVGEAHSDEQKRRFRTHEERQAERVRRLLAGEPVDVERLGYELDGWHIAAIAMDDSSASALQAMARSRDCNLLVVNTGGGALWAWFGGKGGIEIEALHREARGGWPSTAPLSLGEPACGVEGWRFSHRQAAAALTVALKRGGAVRYADVCLLSCA